MSAEKLLDADARLARLLEDDEELRKFSPEDGALGRNNSDYHAMYYMHSQVLTLANQIRQDPGAMKTEEGHWNRQNIAVYDKLVSTAIKAQSELNKMRNQDRMTTHIVREHSANLLIETSAGLGREINRVVEMLQAGEDRQVVTVALKQLLSRVLPPMMTKISKEVLESTIEKFGLPN